MQIPLYPPDPSELDGKVHRLRGLMADRNLEGILLARLSNFFWLTGGRDCSVFLSGDRGEAFLFITPESKNLIVPNVESARLAEEEGLADQGYTFAVQPWWKPGSQLSRLTEGLRWGADWPLEGALDLADDIAHLRFELTAVEMDRYRWLGRASAEALESAARASRPGMTEQEITAELARQSLKRGVAPILMLVGSDERVFRYRHPIPTDKPLKRYAMLVLCGRRWGLVASATRLIHYGPLTEELEQKADAIARVDAIYITSTVVGARVSEIFNKGADAYRAVGYPDEWEKHYQGGAAGYESREFESSPRSLERVLQDQAYAWNPSITGVKSEDTFLVTSAGREFITVTGEWPQTEISIEGQVIARPLILRLDD
jgi:Xaa-Pro aminopeptidase